MPTKNFLNGKKFINTFWMNRDKYDPLFAELIYDDEELYKICVIDGIKSAEFMSNYLITDAKFYKSTKQPQETRSTVGIILTLLWIAEKILNKFERVRFLQDNQIILYKKKIKVIKDKTLDIVIKENLHESCKNRKEKLHK